MFKDIFNYYTFIYLQILCIIKYRQTFIYRRNNLNNILLMVQKSFLLLLLIIFGISAKWIYIIIFKNLRLSLFDTANQSWILSSTYFETWLKTATEMCGSNIHFSIPPTYSKVFVENYLVNFFFVYCGLTVLDKWKVLYWYFQTLKKWLNPTEVPHFKGMILK